MCIVIANLAKSRWLEERTQNVSLLTKSVGKRHLTPERLCRENHTFAKTGGVSEHNRCENFIPAFYDTETGLVAIACFADGTPASLHVLEGLPEEWVVQRDPAGKVLAIKDTVISGFVREGRFYTRAEAAAAVDH